MAALSTIFEMPTMTSHDALIAQDVLIDWLRDAYAMERGLEVTLKKQADNEDLHPDIRAQAAKHLAETQGHAEDVKLCLESLGADTSVIKTGLAEFIETAKGFGTSFAHDERVKDALAAYAAEHFEIACYKALRAAALDIGLTEIATVCDRIIPDEERMAQWLSNNLGAVAVAYLREAATAA